uniref:Endoglucanase n=1 Tax=Limnoria quadripunctata TaxID=161573 RepID=D4HRL4_LIMQU|nr:GH9 family protein [Limnoria quadripunctata]
MKTAVGVLLLVLGAVYAQDDGGCTATGMEPYDYAQALCMSPLFYEAQRSGKLPADQRVTWRKDSALDDGSDCGIDLEGGYYDAGDYVKFGYPFASAMTALAYGLLAYADGYEAAGQTEYGKQPLKWGTDYMLKAKTGTNEFYGQVGAGNTDHSFWGRPEDMTEDRPCWKIDTTAPGTDLAAETAAALAAASIVFQDDRAYSSECLAAARELYDFADQYREKYQKSINAARGFYSSVSYEDELPWAALWLYRATGEEEYMTAAKGFIEEFGFMDVDVESVAKVDWDVKTGAIYALIAELDGGQEYLDKLEEYAEMLTTYTTTPEGLIFTDVWGALREAMNVAFVAARAASLGLQTDKFNDWAQSQIDYALGSVGHSFVCGFGENPPTHPHHASSSCPDAPATCDWDTYDSSEPNPHTLFGALVGGPDENDAYTDDRSDYVHNEVALDYNAFYTGVLAAMVEIH